MSSFLNVTQKQTYKILSFILKKKKFTAEEIIKSTKVSKAWVYRIINKLRDKEFIEKRKKKYMILQATELMGLFHLVRSMKNNKIKSIAINTDKKTVMKELIKRKVIFCLSTALENYSEYLDEPTINFYTNDKKIIEELQAEPKGYTQINIFKPDLCLETETEKKGKMRLTSRIRTIIDLICNEQTYATKALIETEFGERIG
ncbi:MAG: helix-turn-helix domain-containing protein [Candidatus Diapherotrites archaeon]